MKVILEETIKIPDISEKCKFGFETTLTRLLTKVNPEVSMKERLGIYTGSIPKRLFLYKYTKGGKDLEIDRGCFKEVEVTARAFNIPLELIDKRIKKPIELPKFKATLDKFQEEAKEKILKKSQGITVVPTGGGKSVIATSIISHLSQRTLILVHTRELAMQWYGLIKNKLLPGVEMGLIISGRKKVVGDITVATVQSIGRISDQSFFKQFGCIIFDEMHHAAAPTFQEIIGKFPAYYRYGFTATLTRRDGKSFYLNSLFGDVLVELGYKDVSERIILPEIVPISTTLSSDYESTAKIRKGKRVFDYVTAYSILSKDMVRNMTILNLVLDELKNEDSQILILTKRRANAEDLCDFLVSNGVAANVLLGGGSSKKKLKILDDTRNKKNRVLIGTSIADEGLDIITLNTLILASPTSFSGILAQRLGRIMRKHEGKGVPRVYDLVDKDIPEFYGAWLHRMQFYKKSQMVINYLISSEADLNPSNIEEDNENGDNE